MRTLQLHPQHRATIDRIAAILPQMTSAIDTARIIHNVVNDPACDFRQTCEFITEVQDAERLRQHVLTDCGGCLSDLYAWRPEETRPAFSIDPMTSPFEEGESKDEDL